MGAKTAFKADRRGIKVQIPAGERDVLRQLLTQLDELLDDGVRPAESEDPLAAMVGMSGLEGDTPDRPEDPAVARLLPDGNRDDEEAAAEYRRFTERGLRDRKRTGARTAAAALSRPEPVVLDDAEALSLLKAITDVRLVMGERLDLRTDEDAAVIHDRLWSGDGDPQWLAAASTYEVLTVWQEHLVAAVTKRR